MAGKSKTTQKKTVTRKPASEVHSKPAFPYATKPNSLRKFLEQIPKRPKPAKVNADTLKAWDLKDTNDQSIIRVLKALGLVGSNNEPTDLYTEYMKPGRGPGVLGQAVKEVWAPLFALSHEPHREDEPTLRNYFNIHSGGSSATIGHQMQTFKAACDFSDFSTTTNASPTVAPPPAGAQPLVGQPAIAATGPGIHIDLHIHLPENKSRRDYEYIFEDIAKYIFGRTTPGGSNE